MSTHNPELDLRSYEREIHRHQHEYHQLVLPVTGQLAMTVGTAGGEVSGHQAAFIAAGESHSFSSEEGNCFLVADVPAAITPNIERLPAFLLLDTALSRYIGFLHQQLLHQSYNGYAESHRTMLLLLVQLLMERHGCEPNIDKRINAAREWMDQHFRQDVSLAGLAEVAHLSQRQLVDLFKQYFGRTPHHYLLDLRMQHARKQLEFTDNSIQQIAEDSGYSNLSAFSHRFRQYFGLSPRHFRYRTK
ncbi:AraC family transcriptional regulator [Hahella ganghwensis]|uniref:AraC family transcriptional regulator n=1 Tax=Hahella ganghwensis TaxID=286420 RepID=UPI0003808474|nr:AraC family transcriptional regulator [Hahella ganghwensis]